jgi:hypothetical protein
VIARNEGDYSIPGARIAYFDPIGNRYRITELSSLNFIAKRDPNANTVAQTDLRFEIKPITGLAQWTSTNPEPLYQKGWVWTLIILPVLLTGGAFGFKQYQDRMNTDTAFARSRTASDKADKTLKEAEGTHDIKQGYHLLEKALIQFITDKLNLPPAGLSHHDIIAKVEEFNKPEITTELKQLLTKCETIAYAPNATQETLSTDINKTKEVIKKIGKLV